jgi:hypothetical protein
MIFCNCLPLQGEISRPHHTKVVFGKAKRLPGNRVASSLGRIVPTEAKPSELSGEILSLAKYRVKAKTRLLQVFGDEVVTGVTEP